MVRCFPPRRGQISKQTKFWILTSNVAPDVRWLSIQMYWILLSIEIRIPVKKIVIFAVETEVVELC